MTDGDDESAALIAYQVRSNEWLGEWTFDELRVAAVDRYLERNLRPPSGRDRPAEAQAAVRSRQ